MNALELLEICEQSGVKVELADHEHITVEPIEQLSNDLLNQLKEHKRDIIDYLLSQQRNSAPLVANAAGNNAALTQRQQRALNGFFYMLDIQRQNLAKNDYSDHSAMVNVIEWRNKVQRTLCIDGFQMQKIEDALIKHGLIAYASTLKSWLIEGNGKITASQINITNPECLHDGTAKGFYDWLYATNAIQ